MDRRRSVQEQWTDAAKSGRRISATPQDIVPVVGAGGGRRAGPIVRDRRLAKAKAFLHYLPAKTELATEFDREEHTHIEPCPSTLSTLFMFISDHRKFQKDFLAPTRIFKQRKRRTRRIKKRPTRSSRRIRRRITQRFVI